MSVWTEFLANVCSYTDEIPTELEDNISHINVGRDTQDGVTYQKFGIFGITAKGIANSFVDFIETNHPLGITDELKEFIYNWRDIPEERNARLGLNISSALGEETSTSHNANTVLFGGAMPFDCWWFLDEYDIASQYANTSQLIEGIGGGIRMAYDLGLERFTSIKCFPRGDLNSEGGLGNRTYAVDENKQLTFVAKQFCDDWFYLANNNPGSFEDVMPDVLHLKDKYHKPEYIDDEDMVRTIVTIKMYRKVGGEDCVPENPDQGSLVFSCNNYERSGVELPIPDANTVINNTYRIRPYTD